MTTYPEYITPYGAPVDRFDPEESPVDGTWRTPYGAPLANPTGWRFREHGRIDADYATAAAFDRYLNDRRSA